ncbi:MAG: hypothetical protein HQL03_05975 [Nitrospirae bacterium]|nr:hypothetical protein [Nitrospirota bacterium]MBF0592673.1 hypothetical protein [Nitrospirota bacterium]
MKKTTTLSIESIDQETLKRCREVMQSDIGSLKDLPPGLANALANLYYRFVCLSTASCCEESIGAKRLLIRQQVPGMQTAKALAAVEAMPQMINELRTIDRAKNPLQYRTAYELIIDYVKYDIKDAARKPLPRRIIERLFKRVTGQVKEIPDLISKLDFG